MLHVLGCRQFIVKRFTVILSQNFAYSGASKPTKSQASSIPNVPGLSDKVLCVPNEPVGFAGAAKNKEYKNPEYFCYHIDSFADSFVEMEKYRLPVPDNRKPFKN
ncbi:uncharacterized protein LOC131673661 [Phymastichus coffea]|uniref:uncharacterized protein LOC131673661 n=1 Tax=Phymastichus coffea TaxID=108790 RepID=UPI00273ABDB8|nr:uncharacterized protein LOC131673661 [Phymastichus coffea]